MEGPTRKRSYTTMNQGARRRWKPYTKGGGKTAPKRRTAIKVLSSFPRQMFVKLTYVDVDRLYEFITTAVPVATVWRLNGAYDPQYAVGGGQPRYFDTFLGTDGGAAPYKTYCVYKCKAEVTLKTVNGVAATLVVGPRCSAAAPTTQKSALEAGYKSVQVAGTQGQPVKTIVSYVDIGKLWGKSQSAVMDDDNFSATYNTTPALEALLDIMVCPVAATTSNYYVTTKLTYYMRLSDLTNVTDS